MRGGSRTLSFAILGPLEVRLGGDVIALTSQKQAALLAMLLVGRNETLSVERLIEGLWNGTAPATARDALHVHVSRLRRALEPEAERLATRPSGYVLAASSDDLDVGRFLASIERAKSAMAEGNPARASAELGGGLALWRGPAFADLDGYAFARTEARRLAELRLNAVEDRIHAELSLGHHADLVAELETHVAAHPLRERPRRQLMLALYRAGRQAEALEVFRETHSTLLRELGIEPSRPLRALQQAILKQSQALDYRPPRANGRQSAHEKRLVGRDEDLGALTHRLESARLVTLTGPGGVGKTRLAAELSASLASRFERVVYVDLQAVTEAALVGPSIAKALGVRDGEIGADLASKRLLLVLDNFEQVLPAKAVVGELLVDLPKLRLLITSRRRLGLDGEDVYVVRPLALSSARELFRQRGRAVVPEFELTDRNSDAVTEVCRRLDGLPLALELAAARLRLLSPEAIATRLDAPLAVLTRGSDGVAPRHATLRAAIDWSYDLLSAGEQRLFARLSVFVGGWVPEDAEEVVAHGGDFLNDLDSLVTGSLVFERGRTDDQPRFAMLQTIREHAVEKLVEQGAEDDARSRHAHHFVGLAEQGEPALTGGPDQARWVARLDADHDNLRAALQWCRESGEDLLQLRLTGALRRLWLLTGRAAEGRMWLDEALDKTLQVHNELRAKTLLGASSVARMQGDYVAARNRGEAAFELYSHLGDRACSARALSNLAGIASCVGDRQRAAELFEQGIELLRETGDAWGLAVSLTNLGDLVLAAGEAERAAELFGESIELYRQVEDAHGIEIAVSSLGVAKLRTGDFGGALPLLEEALGLAVELGDREGTARCLEDLAFALAATRDHENATRALGSAADIRDEIGSLRTPVEQTMFDETLGVVREALDPADFGELWESGKQLDATAVLELATAVPRA